MNWKGFFETHPKKCSHQIFGFFFPATGRQHPSVSIAGSRRSRVPAASGTPTSTAKKK